MSENLICVGAIAGGFGVHGEVRLRSFCSTPSDITKYSPLIDEQNRTYTLLKLRDMNEGFAAKITEIPTKEAADALKGTRLFASRDKFPNLKEDEYYHSDLIGLDVFTGDGAQIGRVKSVQNFGASDLLEIQFGAQTVLVPFTVIIVPTVDIAARKIIIDPPEGLLE